MLSLEPVSLREIRELEADRDVVTVSWNLSNVCNYRCGYCEEEFNGGDREFPDLDKIAPFLGGLDRAMAGKKLVFEIKGGEPTLWNDLPKFTSFLRARGWHSVVVTNGSRRIDWWKTHISQIDIVCLSFHPQYASIDHFLEVIETVYRNALSGVLVAMDPAHFTRAVEAVNRLRERFPWLSVTPIQLAQPGSGGTLYKYNDLQRAALTKLASFQTAEPPPEHFYNPRLRGGRSRITALGSDGSLKETTDEEVKQKGLNRFSGWSCTAGLNRLHIETDGRVFRGQCRVGGEIGSIYTDRIAFPEETVKCDRDLCFCGPEILLPKKS